MSRKAHQTAIFKIDLKDRRIGIRMPWSQADTSRLIMGIIVTMAAFFLHGNIRALTQLIESAGRTGGGL